MYVNGKISIGNPEIQFADKAREAETMERLEDFVDFSDDESEETGETFWHLQLLNFGENNLCKPSTEFSELYNHRGVHVNPGDKTDIVDGKKLLNDAGYRFVKERGEWMVNRDADIESSGVFVPEWLGEKLHRSCYGEPEKREPEPPRYMVILESEKVFAHIQNPRSNAPYAFIAVGSLGWKYGEVRFGLHPIPTLDLEEEVAPREFKWCDWKDLPGGESESKFHSRGEEIPYKIAKQLWDKITNWNYPTPEVGPPPPMPGPEEIMRDDLHESPIHSPGAANTMRRETPEEAEARQDYEEDGHGGHGTEEREQDSERKHQAKMKALARYGDEARDVFPELFK